MEVREQIRKIKYLRLRPEERFLIDILNKVKKGFNNKYPKSTFFSLDDVILFEQDDKNDLFWVRYDDVWSVLKHKYELNHTECQDIIRSTVCDTLKLKASTPVYE